MSEEIKHNRSYLFVFFSFFPFATSHPSSFFSACFYPKLFSFPTSLVLIITPLRIITINLLVIIKKVIIRIIRKIIRKKIRIRIS